MRIQVFTVDPINAYELKQIRNIVRDTENPSAVFPTVMSRYKCMNQPNKRLVQVWLDSDTANAHEYNTTYK